MAAKESKRGKKSVLEDKEKFKKSKASEALSHMGDKPATPSNKKTKAKEKEE